MAAGPGCRSGSTFVRSMGRYAAGCSGAAGDTSCELRPWSRSGSRSNPLGQTIVRSSGFNDGSKRVVDLTADLWGPMGEPLRDPAVFRQVRLDIRRSL
jgi:hypothetical protein